MIKIKICVIALLFPLLPLIACADSFYPKPPVAIETPSVETEKQIEKRKSLAIREKLAARDLEELDAWWRRINLGDPHKYLLPVILSRLSLPEQYDPEPSWESWLKLEKERPDLYHFRSVYDIRIFFLFRDMMPEKRESILSQYA